MVICIDSGCIIMNFDVIGCGFSYINSECICVNLVKVLEVVSIIVIGFNGIVCFEIDNRVFLYVYFYGVVVLNIDCQVCSCKMRSIIGVIVVEIIDINICIFIGCDFIFVFKIDIGVIVIDGQVYIV